MTQKLNSDNGLQGRWTERQHLTAVLQPVCRKAGNGGFSTKLKVSSTKSTTSLIRKPLTH